MSNLVNIHLSKNRPDISKSNLSRRSFFKWGVFVAGTALIKQPAFAAVHSLLLPERSLYLFNCHTEEILRTVYWSQGRYLPESLAKIDYILRDHYSNKIKPIDTRLLDLLHTVCKRLNTEGPLHIISGYRSRSTNALLRKYDRDVAKGSLHIYGKAVDISLPDCKLYRLKKTAASLKCGGVGYYPERNFVHLDIGRVRYW